MAGNEDERRRQLARHECRSSLGIGGRAPRDDSPRMRSGLEHSLRLFGEEGAFRWLGRRIWARSRPGRRKKNGPCGGSFRPASTLGPEGAPLTSVRPALLDPFPATGGIGSVPLVRSAVAKIYVGPWELPGSGAGHLRPTGRVGFGPTDIGAWVGDWTQPGLAGRS